MNIGLSESNKKNGLVNDSAATKSPRTSPKFFKSHQQQPASFKTPDVQYLVNNGNDSASTHHSITVSSLPDPSNQQQNHQQQLNSSSQLNHVATTCENGINNITGIAQGPLNGKNQTIMNRVRVEKLNGGKGLSKAVKSRTNSKKVKKQEKFTTSKHSRKWRSMNSQNVIVEPLSQSLRFAPEVQSNWDLYASILNVPPLRPLNHIEADNVPRDKRMAQRKIQLQHRVEQFKGIKRYRTTEPSKIRFSETLKLLKHLERSKEQM